MTEDPKAQGRKALRRKVEFEQRTSEKAALPLPKETLWALFDHLNDALADGCDHSLRLTTQFLASHGVAPESVIPWLGAHGGFCDCEVLFNVEERWGKP
ncbi:DUF2695 domain-containing protein [Xanthomonas rydalmerensis]|uniref:DUF2695 domain-containing protein n=1 Tax=Xanthomonas rydalmerensis TaxID=3046274 RepID=A0ABZ0JN72_9XANT|nr:DUF2695 domain-containing protein [Xanthomonas sp. DM-2023]WOS41256.1 DUF2695 domain-containing protein [Xanthomonas sp. DM-2023]WOS45441.1 DUF2695 domain-containing protein [Xanthomonas sp. DM-2023]WOS49620.1 DUF2695 domain-containing protein [Xanthomonas sp. DM-2023]WOS53800.1 DUF2695 domain-containing protein [Xanthomonas sp. DM-2023]WOS57983.1 DUF2695 domain-containing protein [Xanthomonas sp. DM-2023]